MRVIFIFLLIALIHTGASVYAQSSQSKESLEITARKALEWDRTKQNFKAIDGASATQGDVNLTAENLTAFYKKNDVTGEDFDIHTLKAEQNVKLISNDNTVIGDILTYDTKSKHAVMTGQNLKLTTPEQTITAEDTFEYFVETGKLIATGNAILTRPQDSLSANKMTAFLAEDTNGKRTLDRMLAEGNVVIKTTTETARGNIGTYDAKTKLVTLTGNVTIERGRNTLSGNKAEVNLNTQISRIFAPQNADGRVKGTFFPSNNE